MERSCFEMLDARAICGTVPQGAIIVCPHVVTTPTGKVGALMRWNATGGYFVRIAGVNISCPQDWAARHDGDGTLTAFAEIMERRFPGVRVYVRDYVTIAYGRYCRDFDVQYIRDNAAALLTRWGIPTRDRGHAERVAEMVAELTAAHGTPTNNIFANACGVFVNDNARRIAEYSAELERCRNGYYEYV